MDETKSIFKELAAVDVNGHTEKKKSDSKELTYLSWPFALKEVLERYPGTAYSITHWDGKPYFYDPALGYMVETSVTIDGQTKDMWLPVMDSHNQAMKTEPYEVKTKYSSYTVKAASMMDINKAIMRCLVKNFAMFGLGLYIYAGEDLPDDMNIPEKAEGVGEVKGRALERLAASKGQSGTLAARLKRAGVDAAAVLPFDTWKKWSDELNKLPDKE